MTIEEIKNMIASPPYDFLREDIHLKDRMIMLCLGGSHAYGTNTETSDLDLRGCALNRPEDILGMSHFDQVLNNGLDVCVYSFNKMIPLLYGCNPNIIEILGCKSEHYLFLSDIGRELIDNRHMFLSTRAAYTFGGYAFSQLRRLENAIARDKLAQAQKELHIKNSIDKVIRNFNQSGSRAVNYSLDVGDGVHEDFEKETFVTLSLESYPVRDLKALINDINNVIRDYENDLHGRNRKKDDLHLNKHAMHLIRLYLMAIDILEKEEIITYREKDYDLLMSIRNGKFQHEDGTFDSSFFDLVKELSEKMDYAKENTSLPRSPDMKKIEEFMMDVNRKSI